MSLPVFDTPIHTVNLPSNGEAIKFRPFLVKEQKQLLMAASGSSEQQIEAIEGVISACTLGKIDARKLASFDVEYLFMQIRAHSVGEKVDLTLTCPCGAKSNATLDITSVAVNKPAEHSNTIELDQDLLVKMRYPRMREVEDMLQQRDVDAIIRLISTSIDSIWKGDEQYSAADYSVAELVEFVESLPPASLDKIEQFFATMPVLKHDLDWDCTECSAHNTVTLEGMQSFFG
jgi:hypothetical protein